MPKKENSHAKSFGWGFYILPNEELQVAGLKKFERTLREKYNIKA